MAVGFNPPFLTSDGKVLPLQSGIRLIKNDLLQLLLVAEGERVMRPTFGTPIRTTLFEQIDDISLTSLEDDIREKVELFEPRVKIDDLILEPKPDSNEIRLRLSGSVTNEPNTAFSFEIDLVPRSPSPAITL